MRNKYLEPIVTKEDVRKTFFDIKKSFKYGYGKAGIQNTLLKVNKLLPLYPSPSLAWLVGTITGDGTLLLRSTKIKKGKNKNKTITHSYIYYYDQSKIMKQKFMDAFYSLFNLLPKIWKRNHTNNPYKFGSKKDTVLRVRNSAMVRILFCCGIPEGKKVIKSFYVPSWILNCKIKNVKKAYLKGLFESEGGIRPTSISFYMAKHQSLIKNHIFFLNQIKNLLLEFDIETTKISVKELNKTIYGKTYFCGFYIRRKKSLINFFKKIGSDKKPIIITNKTRFLWKQNKILN